MSALTKVECKNPVLSRTTEKRKPSTCSLPSCLVLEVFDKLTPLPCKFSLVSRQWAHLIINGITDLTKKYTVAEAWEHLIGICRDKKSRGLMLQRKMDIAGLDKKGIEGFMGYRQIRNAILDEMATAKSSLIDELTKRRNTTLDPDSSIESLTNLICEEEEKIWAKYGPKLHENVKVYTKEIDLFQKNVLFHFKCYHALFTLATDLNDKMHKIQELFIDVTDHLHTKGS